MLRWHQTLYKFVLSHNIANQIFASAYQEKTTCKLTRKQHKLTLFSYEDSSAPSYPPINSILIDAPVRNTPHTADNYTGMGGR